MGRGVTLFEGSRLGGQLNTARWVENYPGFPEGISGKELAALMAKHLEKNEISVIMQDVKGITREGENIHIRYGDIVEPFFSTIVAIGARKRSPDFFVSSKNVHNDILDIDYFGIDVALIGGGESAFDRALNLKERGARVTVIARSKFKGLRLLQERAMRAGVKMLKNIHISSITDRDGKVNITTLDGEEMTFHKTILCLGKNSWQLPENFLPKNTDILKTEKGFARTSLNGVFLCGDLIAGKNRQTAFAVGSGIAAAIEVNEFLGGTR